MQRQLFLQYFFILSSSVVEFASGHGTLNVPQSNRNHDGTAGTASGGCYGHGCYWFQQSCYIGCTKCTDGSTGGTRPASCQQMAATNPAAANPTWPWGAPGHAPIIDVCGYGGVAIPQGTGTKKGSQLPAKPPVTWKASATAEVAWSVYSDHFGGYQYRLCPTDNAMTEDCFEQNVLDFASKIGQVCDYGQTKCDTFQAKDITTGVKPPGKAWRTNPIVKGSPWYNQYTKYMIVDQVKVPQWPGTYVLQWRWDCDGTSQVWTNCADILIDGAPGPAPSPGPVPTPPPAPKPAFNAQAIALTDQTRKCLDLYGGDTTNGNAIQIWDCNGLDNQKWVFAPGTYEIQYAKDPKKCIDLPGGASAKDGTLLQIWDCIGNANQKWGYDGGNNAIWFAGDSDWNTTYPYNAPNATKPLYSKCIDVPGNDTTNGNKLEVWDCNSLSQQKWLVPSAVTMQLANTNLCLDVPGGVSSRGNALQLWQCNGKENQAFLWSTSYAGYQIRYVPDLSKCIDLAGGDDSDGNWLQLWDCNGLAAQQWYGDQDGTIKRQTDNKKCVDLYGNDQSDGTRIEIWDCNGLSQQKWALSTWKPAQQAKHWAGGKMWKYGAVFV